MVNKLLLSFIILFCINHSLVARQPVIYVGTASTDITPEFPVRLAGFALREKKESAGISQALHAKALAFGTNFHNSALLITIDIVGLSPRITDSVRSRLKSVVKPSHITLTASHTHSGPEIGTLLNILNYTSATTPFDDHLLPAEQLAHINQNVEILVDKLVQVALQALKGRQPAVLSWGIGSVNFSYNRRGFPEAVDHDLPLMKVIDLQGNLKAVFLSYACHAVSLGSKFNQFHGDWVGEARRIIESRHPGAIALVAVGCGGDSNPKKIDGSSLSKEAILPAEFYGTVVADEVDRILQGPLKPLPSSPFIRSKKISLSLQPIPSAQKLTEMIKDSTVKGFYARLALEQIVRGEQLPTEVPYPIQVWSYGHELKLIFLAGEVVADYSLRLKMELGHEHTWVVAYANDVPCYIGSKRVIRAGEYEGELSMYYYNKPSKLKETAEDEIIEAVHSLIKN